MLLSAWRANENHAAALGPKVTAVLEPVLAGLGIGADPDCWIAWGDEPSRFAVIVPSPAGLATVHVRTAVPQEGPRANGKLVRWSRVQIGDYSVETQAGHRLMSFQLDTTLLRAVDDEVEPLAAWVQSLLATMDGRSATDR